MHLTFNFRSGLAPLTLELEGNEDDVLTKVREAIEGKAILDFSDVRGERFLIPAGAIGYVVVPSRPSTPVGFGRM